MTTPKVQITPPSGEPKLSHESVLAVPAVFANVFTVSATPFYARLTFAEFVSTPDSVARAAIALSIPDLRVLSKSITALLQGMDEELSKTGQELLHGKEDGK